MPLDETPEIGPILSTTELREDLFKVGANTLNMQGRAMLVQRQVNLNVLSDPTNAGATAVAAQGTMSKAATYFLNAVIPSLIQIQTDSLNLKNMITALGSALEHVTDPDEAQNMIATVADEVNDVCKNVSETANRTQMSVTATSLASKNLEKAIADLIAVLDGPEGQIAAARKDIEETENDENIKGGGITHLRFGLAAKANGHH